MITIGGTGAAPAGATLRLATEKDLDTLRRLRRASGVCDPLPTHVEQVASGAPFGRVWLMEVHATPAGYLAISWDERGAAVDELMIVPALRGRGLGAWALGVAHAACRGRGLRELTIEVEQVLGAAAAGRCDRTVKRMRMFVPAA